MDIRTFFSRKRKNIDNNNDNDDDECLGPAKKKRKLTINKTAIESNNNSNHNDNNDNDNNADVPSIESLEIETTKQEEPKPIINGDVEEKCVSDQEPEESSSDDEDEDDDIITTTATTNSASNSNDNNKTKSVSSNPISKIKQSSLMDACKYDIIDNCGFTANKEIEYVVMANLFDSLGSTTKRLEKIEMISRLFRSILHLKKDSDLNKSLLYTMYLCCNEIAAPYEGIELGIGDSIILKALCESTGRKLRDIKHEYTSQGDLGDVAVNCRSKQNTLFKPKPLTISVVFETLKKIATTTGSGTQQEKVRNIQRLFVASKSSESRYIVRHLQGKLRIGVNEQTVLSSLGRALAFHEMKIINNKTNKNKKQKYYQTIADLEDKYTAIIKECVSQVPNYEMLIESLIKYGINDLNKHCHLTAGIPIKAMLAKPTKGISEILKRFENMKFTLEYKYDGERAQIHLLPDGTIKIFSRNAEDNTSKFPELVSTIDKCKNKNISSFIIDSEIVAYDRINNTILPFSTLITRKRKNVNTADIKVSVCIYAFDCLLINDKPLISSTFAERRENLYKHFNQIVGEFQFAHHKDTNDSDEILEYLNQAVSVGKCEGLMIKTLDIDATYEPSKRSHNWLKCKKDYLDGIGDTLDLVVMGAFHGTGKRTGNFGSYLVGCYNEDEDIFQSCCKVATGFSDNDLLTLNNETKQFMTNNNTKPIEYETSYECHVWFQPKCVWELKCADLTISPTHSAAVGLAHESKGIALRFPRFIRKREDKKPFSASSAQQIYEMYANQAILQ